MPVTIVTSLFTHASAANATTGITSGNIAVTTGDTIVIVGGAEDGGKMGNVITLSALGGLTGAVTTPQSNASSSFAPAAMGYCTATGTGNIQVKCVGSSTSTSLNMNVGAYVLQNVTSIGNSNLSQLNGGAPSVSFSILDSTVFCLNTDWTANTGARTYRVAGGITPTERDHFADGATYHYDVFDYEGISSGTPIFGETAPTGQTYNIIGLEVRSPAGAAPSGGGDVLPGFHELTGPPGAGGPNPFYEERFIPVIGSAPTVVDMTGVFAVAFATGMVPAKLSATVKPPPSIALGQAVSTFQELARTTAVPAIGLGQGINAVPRVIVKPPTAIASATGTNPTKFVVRTNNITYALAQGRAVTGSIASRTVLSNPPAIANASGITPTKPIVKVFPVPAIALGIAVPPGGGFPVFQSSVPAIATGTGTPPTLLTRVGATAPTSAISRGVANPSPKVRVTVFATAAVASARGITPFDPSSAGTKPDQASQKKRHRSPQAFTTP